MEKEAYSIIEERKQAIKLIDERKEKRGLEDKEEVQKIISKVLDIFDASNKAAEKVDNLIWQVLIDKRELSCYVSFDCYRNPFENFYNQTSDFLSELQDIKSAMDCLEIEIKNANIFPIVLYDKLYEFFNSTEGYSAKQDEKSLRMILEGEILAI